MLLDKFNILRNISAPSRHESFFNMQRLRSFVKLGRSAESEKKKHRKHKPHLNLKSKLKQVVGNL